MDLQEAKQHSYGTVQLAEELKGHAEGLSEFLPSLHDMMQTSATGAAVEAHNDLLSILGTAHEKATELAQALSAVDG